MVTFSSRHCLKRSLIGVIQVCLAPSTSKSFSADCLSLPIIARLRDHAASKPRGAPSGVQYILFYIILIFLSSCHTHCATDIQYTVLIPLLLATSMSIFTLSLLRHAPQLPYTLIRSYPCETSSHTQHTTKEHSTWSTKLAMMYLVRTTSISRSRRADTKAVGKRRTAS